MVISIEAVVSARWKDFYFKLGLPLFSRAMSFNKFGFDLASIVQELNNEFKGSVITPSIYFKDIDEDTIAVREKMLRFSLFSYIPVMHGRVSFNQHFSEIRVTGLANWFPLVFIFFWYTTLLYDLSFERDYLFLLAPVFIFGLIYLVQRNKYIKLCEFIAEIR